MDNAYRSCSLCPRLCRVDRALGRTGFCGETAEPRLAVATLHRGEEPPVSSGQGSGAVFFTGCTLRCSFCQNCRISRGEAGSAVSIDELSGIFRELEARGAANVNLVTGTHAWPAVSEAMSHARRRGLSIPVVWNSSGYELIETLQSYGAMVDLWLPDVKTLNTETARALFRAPDYPDRAKAAVGWIVDRNPLRYDGERLISGCIVRHLVLPDRLEDTREVLQWYARRIGDRALLSLMVQYQPLPEDNSGPKGTVSRHQYSAVLKMLDDLSIEEGFIQEWVPESEWLPDFDAENPFPADFSTVVWHWRFGETPYEP